MLVLGFLITIQFRIQKALPSDPGRVRTEELVADLKDKEEELKAANDLADKLQAKVDELQQALSQVAVPVPKEIPDSVALLSGTTEAQGPGVVVTLTETPEAVASKTRVADEDVWRVIMELNTAGAEAISINGQRLSSATGIRNVSNRILVNQTMITSPVEIQAIGDATVLEASLKLRGGVIELLGRWGIKATVQKNDALKIPALRATPTYRYAKPVKSAQ